MASSSSHSGPHVSISSADDISYPMSINGEINNTIQTIVGGRKCWKTMKGKGEVVWPPHLEAALVEGLEKYQPVESRTSRTYGRFPMRNKFISDYIFKVTGKRRTPKQVGSRLQQLRDTTEGKRILQVLSSRHIEMMRPTHKVESSPEALFTQSPPSTSSSVPSSVSIPPCSYYSIDVLLDQGVSSSSGLGPLVPALSGPSSSNSPSSAGPRPLRSIDPSVTFMSRTPLNAYSSFRVLRDGVEMHSERTELSMRSSSCMPAPQYPSEMECTFWYSTSFVPQYWDHLCSCPDPTCYTVVQDIVRSRDVNQVSPPANEDVLLSVVYNFNNPFATPPLSPDSATYGETDATTYSVESSPELGSEFGDILSIGSSNSSGPVYGGQQCGSSYGGLSIDTNPATALFQRPGSYSSVPPSPLDLNGDWKFSQMVDVDSMAVASANYGNMHSTPACFVPSQHYNFEPHYST